MNKAFYGYKPGTKVYDTWYGNGVVIKRTTRRLHIKITIDKENKVWDYDTQHVKHFIRKGHIHGLATR